MPSPLSGLTQAAASPTRPSWGRPPADGPAHRQERARSASAGRRRARTPRGARRRRTASAASAPPRPAACRWPGCRRRCSPRRCSAGRSSRSRTATPRPAAQLEVAADPRVVGPRGVDVGPRGHAVHRVAVPLPAEQLAQRRPDAVGDDEALAGHLDPLVAAGEDDGGDPPALAADVDRAQAVDAVGAALIAVVRRWWSARCARRRAPAERASGPRQQQGLAEPVGPQPPVDRVRPQPLARARDAAAPDGPRGETVAAGLVAREDRLVGEHHVEPGTRGPGRGGGPRDRHPRRARRCAAGRGWWSPGHHPKATDTVSAAGRGPERAVVDLPHHLLLAGRCIPHVLADRVRPPPRPTAWCRGRARGRRGARAASRGRSGGAQLGRVWSEDVQVAGGSGQRARAVLVPPRLPERSSKPIPSTPGARRLSAGSATVRSTSITGFAARPGRAVSRRAPPGGPARRAPGEARPRRRTPGPAGVGDDHRDAGLRPVVTHPGAGAAAGFVVVVTGDLLRRRHAGESRWRSPRAPGPTVRPGAPPRSSDSANHPGSARRSRSVPVTSRSPEAARSFQDCRPARSR